MSVRMSDVAARAGVSPQTVSRVMRGERWVALETVARVRQAIAELGYHGNAAAGALKRGQTRTLGLLFPMLATTFASFWSDVAAGAETLAHQHGYALLLCDTSDSTDKEAAYVSLLLSHRVAGIVYAQPRLRADLHPTCAGLLASTIPVVVISSDEQDLPYTHVRTDDERAGYVAVRHLRDIGRQRIAIIAESALDGEPGHPSKPAYDRVMGARRALLELGLDADEAPVILAPNTMEAGRRAVALLSDDGGSLPDGIFVATEVLALGLLDALRSRDARVPEDVAIVAHDGLLASAVSVPSLTTIAPPRADMGRTCIDLLVRAGRGEALPPLCLLEAAFIVRESTAGAGRVPRQGLRAPLSAPDAWFRWRTTARTADLPDGEIPVVRLPLGQVAMDRWQVTGERR
jgi:LacI family transcriptional regulator